MICNLQAAQKAMRERNSRPTKLEEEQERMRIAQEVARELDAMIRSAEFRKRVEALFMEYGKTREEAQTFWLRSVFGPTITGIKRDFRTLRELRRRGFTLAVQQKKPGPR